MHGEELAESRALDEVQEERAPCSLVGDVTCGMHLFLRTAVAVASGAADEVAGVCLLFDRLMLLWF